MERAKPIRRRRRQRAPWSPYCAVPRQVRLGNRVELLQDGGAAYPAMLAAIRQATSSINLGVYIFRDDSTGYRFADALRQAAARGVEVNLVYDSLGSLDTPYEFFERLGDAGVRVVEHHPVFPWRPKWSWISRDHRKLLIVDGHIGFVGGINICDDEAPAAWGGLGWRDLHARLEGPGVRDLQRAFLATWWRGGGRRLGRRRRYLQPLQPVGETAVRVVGNFWVWNRRSIRRSMDRAIRAARKFIYLENAYFLPDDSLVRALRRAVRRGVDVRVVVPGQSDVRLVQWATEALYPRLRKAGVRIFEWHGSVLHSKAACVDGMWSTIGSFNLDRWSAVDNLEIAVNVLDANFGEALARSLKATQRSSREIMEVPTRGIGGAVVDRALLVASRWL